MMRGAAGLGGALLPLAPSRPNEMISSCWTTSSSSESSKARGHADDFGSLSLESLAIFSRIFGASSWQLRFVGGPQVRDGGE